MLEFRSTLVDMRMGVDGAGDHPPAPGIDLTKSRPELVLLGRKCHDDPIAHADSAQWSVRRDPRVANDQLEQTSDIVGPDGGLLGHGDRHSSFK